MTPLHPLWVRLTHWINAFSFFGLVISGVAILLAHPRLYWGETGAVGLPSLLDLPLPFLLTGQSGWGRYLHFVSAWFCVAAGMVYLISGLATRHFGRGFSIYNSLQRPTYLAVVFIGFPLMVWTGLAMSPAITSVFPFVVDSLGGTQSARTLHFFAAVALVLFFFGHVTMVSLEGFWKTLRGMITA